VNQWIGDGTDVGRYGGDGDKGQPGTTGDGLIDSPSEAGGWPYLNVASWPDQDNDGLPDAADSQPDDPRNAWLPQQNTDRGELEIQWK